MNTNKLGYLIVCSASNINQRINIQYYVFKMDPFSKLHYEKTNIIDVPKLYNMV